MSDSSGGRSLEASRVPRGHRGDLGRRCLPRLPHPEVRDTIVVADRAATSTDARGENVLNQNALTLSGGHPLASRFEGFQRLTVRQRKRWVEILLSVEMKNEYDVFDQTQTPVLHVREEGSGFLSLLKRVFLGPFRPFTASVTDASRSEPWMQLRRPFRFIFHRLEVHAADGTLVGAIQKKWSWVRRIYDVEDGRGQVVAELFGPLLKPWTFEIRVRGQTRGAIRKRWSGWGKEFFTDADNFGVELANLDRNLKVLAFAATVLIDVVHFERSKG
jgi:uncharacterized protein YxjI